jgi:NhaP-type Na+/H+ or K+/H+ antiporter
MIGAVLLSAIAVVSALAIWALFAGRLERWHVTAPMVFVLAGVAVGFGEYDMLAATLNTDTAQAVAEVILAILLFIDASDVRGGLFGRDAKSAVRILLVAMPLGLAMSVALGLWLLPGLSWAIVLIIACVVVPIDFAPAATVLRDERLPERVRNLLNVEAGYNDGIVSPIFIFGLVLAGDSSHAESPVDALAAALPQAVKAILIGLALGVVLALATNLAERRDLMSEQAKRMILVTLPLLGYTLSIAVHGNGFVAAFVCGIAYFGLRSTQTAARELELLDDIGFLLTVVMWFVFGAAAVLALSSGVSVGMVVFCLLALTLVRMIPVLLAMLGSRFSWPERLLIGWLGPRGTTSIVFGLLAFNVLSNEAETDALLTMVLVVLGSVVMHGLGAPAAARAYARSQPRMAP